MLHRLVFSGNRDDLDGNLVDFLQEAITTVYRFRRTSDRTRAASS